MSRPIRNFPDEVDVLAVALRDELRMDDLDAAEIATFLIGSDWFRDLTGVSPSDRHNHNCACAFCYSAAMGGGR